MSQPAVQPLARRLIAVFLVVALLPLVATVGLSYWSSRAVVADLLEENLGKTARLYASEVDDFLAEKTGLLTALAGGIAPEDQVLAEVVQRSPMIEELIWIASDGQVQARSQQTESWAVDACRSGEPGITPMTHAHHGHGHEVVVSVAHNGGGRLCGRVSFTLHQDMISERARSTFGGLAYIVDRQGDVVCHAFEEDEPHVHPGQPLLGPAAEHAKIGVAWHGVIDVDGQRHLAAFAPATNLPWGVWAEVPMADAADVLRPLTTRSLLFGGLLAAALSLLILFLVRRIAAPIEALAAAAQRIAGGAVGETVQVSGNDEISQLAREFNTMSEALATSVSDLDRKVAERTAELSEARHFSETLLDTVQQRILVIGPELMVVQANRAATEAYGLTLVGRSYHDLHPKVPGKTCPIVQIFETQQPSTGERLAKLSDGRTQILSIERYPVPGPDGPQAVLELERDVTEVRQFQAHLVHQEKMAALGTLAAGLAHEIGNPLASLSSELQLLALDPSGAPEAMPILQDQVRRMGTLLRELVNLGRSPAEQDQESPFTAMDAVNDVIRLLRHEARDKGVSLTAQPPLQEIQLYCSRDRLVQILINLALNAIDAGGDTVVVSVESMDPEQVALVVRDNGHGLPEQRERLFEPFFTTKAVGKGSGLGLFVVDRLVDALGGSITASNNTQPGQTTGAMITVVLPQGRDKHKGPS